jgi:hypothetical protein
MTIPNVWKANAAHVDPRLIKFKTNAAFQKLKIKENNETVSQFELRLRQAEKARLQVGCSPTSDFDLTLMLHTAVISHGYFGQKVKRERSITLVEVLSLITVK